MIGNVLLTQTENDDGAIAVADSVRRLQLLWCELIKRLHVKAFSEVAIAPTLREGAASLNVMSGVGFMKPNTVRANRRKAR